jgi:hypothetical protein
MAMGGPTVLFMGLLCLMGSMVLLTGVNNVR